MTILLKDRIEIDVLDMKMRHPNRKAEILDYLVPTSKLEQQINICGEQEHIWFGCLSPLSLTGKFGSSSRLRKVLQPFASQ